MSDRIKDAPEMTAGLPRLLGWTMEDEWPLPWWMKKRYAVAAALLFATLFSTYVVAYLVLSRRGYADARRFPAPKSFYYLPPKQTEAWPKQTEAWRRNNLACIHLFAPLNAIDRKLGLGMDPSARDPGWSTGK